jgi:hypothetical protein
VAPWITVLSRHTVFTTRVIYYKFILCDIPRNKAPRTGRHIWHTASFLWPQEGHRRQSRWADFAGHCLWLLLLRLAAVLLLLPKNRLLISLAFAPDSEAVSATRISLMASSLSFTYFFLAITRDAQSSALFTTMYDLAQFQTRNTSEYECLLQ